MMNPMYDSIGPANGSRCEVVEPYIRHRPLTSLTHGVSQENVKKITETLNGLGEKQRQAFSLVEREGQLFLNHWFVLVSARRSF
jgi:hypothetical protein